MYLDNAATTQKPVAVLEALDNFYRSNYANVHRGIYWPANKVSQGYETARERIGEFLNADADSIVFTHGTTEAINKVAFSLSEILSAEDEILITELEHHSNLVPWQVLSQKTGSSLKFLEIDNEGVWSLDKALEKVSPVTRVIALALVSNTLGVQNEVPEFIRKVEDKNRITFVDAAQSVAHQKTDVKELHCSLLAFSGHKIYAPMGIGVLYGRHELLEELAPFNFGGGMIKEVQKGMSLYRDAPHKHEAGTPNVGAAIGLATAIDYLDFIGWDFIEEHLQELTQYALQSLGKLEGVTIYGPVDQSTRRGPIISFNLDGIHPHDIAGYLAEEGIAIRAGHHCTQPLMESLDIQASCRISFAIYNTKEEIDHLVSSLKQAEKFFS